MWKGGLHTGHLMRWQLTVPAQEGRRWSFFSGERWDGGCGWVDGVLHLRIVVGVWGVIFNGSKTIDPEDIFCSFVLLSFVVLYGGWGKEGWVGTTMFAASLGRGSGRVRGIHVAGGHGYVWRSPFRCPCLGFGAGGKSRLSMSYSSLCLVSVCIYPASRYTPQEHWARNGERGTRSR